MVTISDIHDNILEETKTRIKQYEMLTWLILKMQKPLKVSC